MKVMRKKIINFFRVSNWKIGVAIYYNGEDNGRSRFGVEYEGFSIGCGKFYMFVRYFKVNIE